MKFFYSLLFILLLSNRAFSADYEFTPINFDFDGLEAKGDTVVAYGGCGSFINSSDGMETWSQIRVFDRGDILGLFIESDRWVAVSELGQTGISYDGGISWLISSPVNDSLVAVIGYPGGYFLRSYDKLYTLSKDLSISGEKEFYSRHLGAGYYFNYRFSIAFFKNKLIAETDSARQVIFDTNLNAEDTLDFSESGICEKCFGHYQVFADDENFYSMVNDTIFKTNDLKNFEKVYYVSPYFNLYKLIDKKVYVFENPEHNYMDDYKCDLYIINNKTNIQHLSFYNNDISHSKRITDLLLMKNEIVLSGNRKLLLKAGLGDDSLQTVSDLTGITHSTLPDIIDKDEFLLTSGYYYNSYNIYVYGTDNSFITGKSNITPGMTPHYRDFRNFDFKYFDLDSKTLYFGGYAKYKYPTGGALISENLGRTFEYKPMPDFQFGSYPMHLMNFQKVNNRFYTAKNNRYNFKDYCNIFVCDIDFNKITRILDSNMRIYYINARDDNNYLVYSTESFDNSDVIKYTSNRGISWTSVKNYQTEDSLLFYKEIDTDEKSLTVFFIKNIRDTTITIDILDRENRTIETILKYKLKDIGFRKDWYQSIDYDSSVFYIPIEDTLFYTENLYEKGSWKYHLLPNNGKIIRTFKKFGDKFYARYMDDLHPDNVYWIKVTETNEEIPPVILTGDMDFDKKDIKDTTYDTRSVKIYNKSKSVDLEISGYSGPYEPAFTTGLPEIDESEPLIIKPQDFYEFSVSFKPNEEKIYRDSIIFHSNALELDSIVYLRGEGIDTNIVTVEDIDMPEYIYVYPPFPQPASEKVKMHVYWDLRVEFDPGLVRMYDIYGSEIPGDRRVSLEMVDSYSGYLNVDCSDIPVGVYLVVIRHGSNSRIVKVIISR